MQQNSSSEVQIQESSARNVVGLKRIDTKGNSSSSSSSKKRDTLCRWEEDHGITRQVLQQQFDKSRDDAAKILKVSPSTLKRACRDLGITRWPNHNRKEDVKKHKGRSEPCPVPPPAPAEATMSVKVTYQNDTVRFPLSSSSSTMKYLEEQLETRFKIPVNNMCIKYQDEEDEWISVMCDSDLMYCLDVLRSCGKSVIRMVVTPKSLTPQYFNQEELLLSNLAGGGMMVMQPCIEEEEVDAASALGQYKTLNGIWPELEPEISMGGILAQQSLGTHHPQTNNVDRFSHHVPNFPDNMAGGRTIMVIGDEEENRCELPLTPEANEIG